MKIKCKGDLLELHKIVPHPRNANKHPDKQIHILAKIIDHLGQRHPLIISRRSGFLIAGHGRLLALQRLGWEKCAVEYQDFESDAEEFSFLIADNKITELAEHDDLKMIEGIKDLNLEGMDFELLGLEDFEIEIPKEVDYPNLGDGSDPDCQRAIFIISNEQKNIMDKAFEKALKNLDCTDEINENFNGNILSAILKNYVNS